MFTFATRPIEVVTKLPKPIATCLDTGQTGESWSLQGLFIDQKRMLVRGLTCDERIKWGMEGKR